MQSAPVRYHNVPQHYVICPLLFMKHIYLLCFHFTGNMQQMDEEKKGLWKTLMDRFSKSPEDVPEKNPEK